MGLAATSIYVLAVVKFITPEAGQQRSEIERTAASQRVAVDKRINNLVALANHRNALPRGRTAEEIDFAMRALQEARSAAAAGRIVEANDRLEWADGLIQQGRPYVVEVLYGTDRRATPQVPLHVRYGSERGNLETGVCSVSIPPWPQHKEGEVESPSRLWNVLHLRRSFESPYRHVVLLSTDVLTDVDFVDELRARLERRQPESRTIFLFVHGYNMSFEDACKRTAQLWFDLRYLGVPVMYSWPSNGSTVAYPHDAEEPGYSAENLVSFIKLLSSCNRVRSMDLLAHSMGGGVFSRAAAALSTSGCPIDELVLAAPDVDADVFARDILPVLGRLAKRTTLYASSNDKALGLSEGLWRHHRLGEAGEWLFVRHGIDTIDASLVDTDFLGHSYYGDGSAVTDDLAELVNHHTSPSSRRRLVPMQSSSGRFYVFSP